MNNFPEHIKWLADRFGKEIVKKSLDQSVGFPPETTVYDVLRVMMAADPSERKLAVDWMLKIWLKDGFLWEDVCSGERSKTYETLSMFAKYRGEMTRENRNLANYTSLGSVWRAIEPFEQAGEKDDISSRELKRELKQKVLSETLVLKYTEDQIAIVPLTVESSMWWGRGTRWCTSARDDNYFDQYNCLAPLIILVFPQGLRGDPDKKARKFQLWTNKSSFHFMDEADETVDANFIADNWNDFEPLIEWAIGENVRAVEYLPPNKWTVEIRDKVINESLELANYIPLNLLDEEFCHKWIASDEYFINAIEQEKFSLNTKKFAVSLYPGYLHLLPDIEKTREICWNAINNFSSSFHYVPDQFKTEEMCNKVLNDCPNLIGLVPDRFITQEICNRSINYDASCFVKIPDRFKTREICAEALYGNFNNIKIIPKEILDEQMIIKALAFSEGNYICDWKLIPDHLLTKSVLHCYLKYSCYELSGLLEKLGKNNCLETISLIVEMWGENALEDIYTALTDIDIAELLTKKYPQSIYCLKDTVLEHTITEEKCINAALDGLHLTHVPEKFKTKEVCRVAVKNYMGNIAYIPPQLGNKFLKELVDENPEALFFCRYANRSLATNEFWIECLEQYSQTIELIPEDILTPEIMNKLLEKDVGMCKRISKNSEREWMFLLAVEKQPDIINQLDAQWQTQAVQEQAIKGGFPREEIKLIKEPEIFQSKNNRRNKVSFVSWNHSDLDGLRQRLTSNDKITPKSLELG